MTENEFINRELDLWGFEEVEVLFGKGFKPVLTDKGWRWLLTQDDKPATMRSRPARGSLPLSTSRGSR
jgi:hypothetical protein